MVKGVEDLRTPLREIIDLDKRIRGTLSGFMMPSFVVDLPGGGGKRLVSTHESYDEKSGVATYIAPGLDPVKAATVYTYYDPKPVKAVEMATLSHQKNQALETGQTLEQLIQSTFLNPSHKPMPKSQNTPDFSQKGVRTPLDKDDDTKRVPMPAVSRDNGRRCADENIMTEGIEANEWSHDIVVDHDGGQQLAASG